jgi:hypothetical protein
MRNLRRAAVLLAAGLMVCACGLGNQPPVFDNDVGWVFENIDPTYWTKSGTADPGATAFRNFWVHVADPDGNGDITYIKVTDSGGYWWLLQDSDSGYSALDPSGDFWGGWTPYYCSPEPYRVGLGTYTTLVLDSGAHEISRQDSFTGPGGASGYTFAYTEEYSGGTSGGTPMVKRATALSGTKTGDRVSIQFSVSDGTVYNGWVWLYDSSERYIGSSNRFGAGTINTSGANTRDLLFTELNLGTHSSAEIAGFHVVLVDGAQYAPGSGYDFRSVSAYTTF